MPWLFVAVLALGMAWLYKRLSNRTRRQLPKALQQRVDIAWDDLARVLGECQREAEDRQMRGVRRSVRPYVDEMQERYGVEEIPTTEELIEVSP
jgi:predicted solute-binding protein